MPEDLPGNACVGHHSKGFDTKEDAENHMDNRPLVTWDKSRVDPWNGVETPASVVLMPR